MNSMSSMKKVAQKEDHVLWLSIGTLYHRVTLSDDRSQIQIMKFQPRRPSSAALDRRIKYKYRFQVG